MRTFILAFSWIFLFSAALVGQNEQGTKRKHICRADSLFKKTVFLKTNPWLLIDFINGGCADAVIETFPTEHISISIETGVYYRLAGYNISMMHGFRSGVEFRKYFQMENTTRLQTAEFIGIRYLHKQQNFFATDSILIPDHFAYQKKYEMHKSVDVVDLIFGLRQVDWWNMNEVYIGVGFRYKEADCGNLSQAEMDNRDWGDSFAFPWILGCGRQIYPDFLIGMRFGIGLGHP